MKIDFKSELEAFLKDRKNLIILILVIVFTIVPLVFKDTRQRDFPAVRGTTTSDDDKIRAVVLADTNLSNAVKQMRSSLLDAISKLNEAKRIDVELEDAMACVVARGSEAGLSLDDSLQLLSIVRNDTIITDEQNRKYIAFHGAISGTMRTVQMPDVARCK